MKTLSTINDPVYTPKENPNFIDRLFTGVIRDERDMPFIYLALKIIFFIIPGAVALFFLKGWLWWAFAIPYFVFNNFILHAPFSLMLHCTSHRKFFKKEYEFLNSLMIPWFLGFFFGQTPETYYSHHIQMHHSENNLEDDISSTMFYQRDSLWDFIKYYSNFFFIGIFQLLNYFHIRKRPKFTRKVFVGEIVYFALCIGMCFVNLKATVLVFIIPFFVSRFIMMMGNWTQHAFINPENPGNPYMNSITCINVLYNKQCWNDGYHISHHQKPHMHWTQHPVYFKKTVDTYEQHKAVVFDGIDFLFVFIYLMAKNYDKLADHLVNINNMFQSKEEAIAVLKNRTKKFELDYEVKAAA